ncbi:hypothetical protein LSCM1_07018 [Leishmania martiniquensis]|uniref:Nucleoside phosphatase n=1 Tax=Leishmania martiniquensis TaxID=1580590 RepID=A0A836L0X0_9TRYP|nr:hypothetical protein LSCM1_07018 [Leishmania martiniquensis]
MTAIGGARRGKLPSKMTLIVIGVFAAVMAIVFLTAYEVGVSTANPRLSHYVQLTEIAVRKSEATLARCHQTNDDLLKGGEIRTARVISEMERQKEELKNILALERERVASARSLLLVCEDELAKGLKELFGVADQNVTARLEWLRARRTHLEAEHARLTDGPFGVMELRRSSDIRALQAALFHEMRAHQKGEGDFAGRGDACAQSSFKYSVVFDIGSTGNRVHVYKYAVDPLAQITAAAPGGLSQVDLVEELFELNHKALSQLENPVEEAPEVLWELYIKAKNFVPAELHGCTPVEFKATAGLRMLSRERAAEILAGIRARYRNETFWLRGSAPVRILEAREEGPLAWLTVNFLLGAFANDAAETSTAAIIDLGGGSTQIVFEPAEHTFHQMHTDLRYSASVGSRTVRAYQHSYEGYGLHAATTALLLVIEGGHQYRPDGSNGTATTTSTTRPIVTTTAADGGLDDAPPHFAPGEKMGANKDEQGDTAPSTAPPTTTLPPPRPPPGNAEVMEAFPCFAVGYEDPTGVRNIKKNDAGEPVTHPNFQACVSLFRDRLLKPAALACEAVTCGIAGVFQPPLAAFAGDIYAFSFVFDLLDLANRSLLPEGGVVSSEKFEVRLTDMEKIGEAHCSSLTLDRIGAATARDRLGSLKPEYECMYYSYMYALLRHGYEVPEERVLHVAKRIRGYEAAWSLGASLVSLM